jgi:hypothetical protein
VYEFADRHRVNRSLIVWLAMHRQCIARALRSTLTVLARGGEVAMDSRENLFEPLSNWNLSKCCLSGDTDPTLTANLKVLHKQ